MLRLEFEFPPLCFVVRITSNAGVIKDERATPVRKLPQVREGRPRLYPTDILIHVERKKVVRRRKRDDFRRPVLQSQAEFEDAGQVRRKIVSHAAKASDELAAGIECRQEASVTQECQFLAVHVEADKAIHLRGTPF